MRACPFNAYVHNTYMNVHCLHKTLITTHLETVRRQLSAGGLRRLPKRYAKAHINTCKMNDPITSYIKVYEDLCMSIRHTRFLVMATLTHTLPLAGIKRHLQQL